MISSLNTWVEAWLKKLGASIVLFQSGRLPTVTTGLIYPTFARERHEIIAAY